MCGIVGVVGNPNAPMLTLKMLQQIIHRGPDGNGIINYSHGSLGMCRLRIRSQLAQSLPIVDEQTSSYIAYNGEVYGQLKANGNITPAPQGGSGEVQLVLLENNQ